MATVHGIRGRKPRSRLWSPGPGVSPTWRDRSNPSVVQLPVLALDPIYREVTRRCA